MSMPHLVAISDLVALAGLFFSQLPMTVSRFAALVAGRPARIDVGGVDEGEAGIDEGVEQS